MAEKLFSLLRAEQERLKRVIAELEAGGAASPAEIQRLEALHGAITDQIGSWMRDLDGDGAKPLRCAA
ncbi:hypothetical protein WBP07_24720 [Novosphingobium sp. BL-8A]|uniref:hypothetical protein n=1 Tax=Novosphingobium sp. BL-8A TaxID=3127639 RepID=UPI0037578C53